jgi:uncharacterized protein
MHKLSQIDANTVPPTPWRNGGGQTRELLTRPEHGPWQLRISLADIDRDGPFSAFAGTQRWFAVIEGAGVLLRFGERVHTVTPDSTPLRFDGAAAPECSLLDGPTRDLNLMQRSGTAVMQPAQADRPWDERCAERGLFTTSPGTLHRAGDEKVPLASHTLVWFLGPGPCRFQPRLAGHAGRAGWWLGWSPSQVQGD